MSKKKEAKKQKIQSINNQISEFESEISGLRSRLANLENSENRSKTTINGLSLSKKPTIKMTSNHRFMKLKALLSAQKPK